MLDAPAGADVSVRDAHVVEPPPGALTAAAYLVLDNAGESDAVLRTVTSGCCERIEIHRTLHEAGIARMRRLESLVIPANGHVTLAPGGIHLMLTVRGELRRGAIVSLTLEFADGSRQQIAAPVRPAPGPRQPSGDDHGHH